MPAPVWWEIETQRPTELMEFLGALMGWSFERAFEGTDVGAPYWIVRDGGAGIGGVQQRDGGVDPQVGTRIYFDVEDLEASLERVARLGGRTERPRTALGGDDRWYATFQEPTGVSIGLWTANAPR